MLSLKPNPVLQRARKPINVPTRVVINYEPTFEGEIEGLVKKHLKRDFWRVACSMEYDDVLQEARLVFLKIAAKYPGVEARHFMALFKTSWQRRFADLSTEDTEHRKTHPYRHGKQPGGSAGDLDWTENIGADQFVGATDNDGFLKTMIRQAPREVKMVLNLFLNAPQELIEVAHASFKEDARVTRRNPSARICSMLGLPPDMDVMKMTAEYFSEQSH